MDLNKTESDTSISLDTTWFVLDENAIKEQGDYSSFLEESSIKYNNSETDIFKKEKNRIESDTYKSIEEGNKDLEDPEAKDIENIEIINNLQPLPLIPLTVAEIKDIRELTSGRRFKEFYSRQLVKCDLSCIAKLLLLLGKISIGSFLISFCILSLILLSQISWNYFENNQTKLIQDPLPQQYTVLNNNNTWYNTYYPTVFEEDMILRHSTNKFKHGFWKGRGKNKRLVVFSSSSLIRYVACFV